MIKKTVFIIGTACLTASCTQTAQVGWVSTTPESGFVEQSALKATAATDDAMADVTILTDKTLQEIDGFGGCFNELGWVTISSLNEADRDAVVKDLFGPEGMNFTFCRMPVGANDFARDWYSYNETDGDFEMKNFSIDNDRETLIPFIHAAQKVNPSIRIWASPWSPPTWMKYGKHYACRAGGELNLLDGDPNVSQEGANMFIQKAEYFNAYALYFRKFIEAYRNEGIDIEMIAPQNEFNSCQIFPSCTWTADGLSAFIGDYLGPQMKEIGVRVMFGTMERPNHLLVDTVMQRKSGAHITGIGFQWAGKEAIAKVHETYPDMRLMQTESECGNGQNSWEYCFYIWEVMKHYFNHGISSYMYWNISLHADAADNRWKWPQNSLISVDTQNKTYRYNPEYYLMKHLSHFVKPGARRLATDGDENALAFINPDKSVVLLTANATSNPQTLTVRAGGRLFSVTVPPQSINTFTI
ncbi:MAG: beta-glycosidase [Tannerella sp.]|jgi:glucosylceramidase|nr:beta-glycosidase [Tannerella sp.]